MCKKEIAGKIKQRALELGFEGCGIIRIDKLRDYEAKLEERIEACPESKPMLEQLRKYAHLDQTYEWAKSVIVCTIGYSEYKVPDVFNDQIGKYYLYDHKLQPDAEMNKNILEFEKYLQELGVKFAKELHGITAGRLAAEKAGLGIIRRNNFLYTKSGSWVIIDTWVIDQEMELIEKTELKECPEGCRKCIDACPTKALIKPYCTNMATCITRLTWGIKDLLPEDLRKNMKGWIYGCDECQNACPMNKDIRGNQQDYPGLEELAEKMSLEKLFLMEDNDFLQIIVPKFWFIRPESLWIWKVNVLRSMVTNYKEEYSKYIMLATKDENEKIREMANWAAKVVGEI